MSFVNLSLFQACLLQPLVCILGQVTASQSRTRVKAFANEYIGTFRSRVAKKLGVEAANLRIFVSGE